MGPRLLRYKFYILQAEVLYRVNIIICYIKPLHVHVVTKPDESLTSVMTVKSDGHFGSVEHDTNFTHIYNSEKSVFTSDKFSAKFLTLQDLESWIYFVRCCLVYSPFSAL